MKTRAITGFAARRVEIYDKATKVTSVTNSNATNGAESFTVLADNLNGDYKTTNLHEFRKNVNTNYNGFYTSENSATLTTVQGMVGPFTNFVSAGGLVNWTNLYNSALSRLYDQIRTDSVGSGLDLSVDIAEGRQVGRMLGDVGHLANYVRSFHPRNWANKWLEYQYGWRPLVSSIYDSYQALMYRRLYSYMHVTGKAKDRYYTLNKFSDVVWNGSSEEVGHFMKSRYKIVAEYQIQNTVRQQLAGYTSLNPVSIAWELMPYSFVVDWVYNIGGYLKNVESALLYKTGFVRGYTVQGYLSLQSAYLRGGGTQIGTTTNGVASAFYRQSYKLRAPIGVFPFPRIPRFNSNLGWQQCLSGASLMSQHLGLGRR